jgi:hypothetical protein
LEEVAFTVIYFPFVEFQTKITFFSTVESPNEGPQFAFITTGSGLGKVSLTTVQSGVAQLYVHGPCRLGTQLQTAVLLLQLGAPRLTNSRVSTTCIGRQHKANNSDPEEPSSSMASALFSDPQCFLQSKQDLLPMAL